MKQKAQLVDDEGRCFVELPVTTDRFAAACHALYRIWGPVLRDNPALTVEEAMSIPGGREAYRRIVRAFWLEDADADDSALDSELDGLCESLVSMVLAGLEVPGGEPVF